VFLHSKTEKALNFSAIRLILDNFDLSMVILPINKSKNFEIICSRMGNNHPLHLLDDLGWVGVNVFSYNSMLMSGEDTSHKSCSENCKKILNRPCFLELLRVELQRLQRSKSELSIVLLTVDAPADDTHSSLNLIIKNLRKRVRDSDIIGFLDNQTIGLILPYTDKQGAQNISEKLRISLSGKAVHISLFSYPEQIFEDLAKQGCVSSDVLDLMFDDETQISRFRLGAKRIFDVIGACIGLVVLSPLMLLTALLIKMDSPGPVIFKQIRLGAKGRQFTFYKFRSMRNNNNDQIHRDYVLKLIGGNQADLNQGNQNKPCYKIKYDPRVTAFGKFIRKTSIDELPQLFNVVKGDMSLVGPRPPLAYEAANYKAWHLRRILDMKPGMTGLWQVEGRSRMEFNEAVRLDVRYVRSWSLLLDLKLLLKTIVVVCRCRGAV
jgi:lipopolysaccharide/colanic/teichoic acid biosynthesis glycosyltransferase